MAGYDFMTFRKNYLTETDEASSPKQFDCSFSENIPDIISTFKKNRYSDFNMNDSAHKCKFPNGDYMQTLHKGIWTSNLPIPRQVAYSLHHKGESGFVPHLSTRLAMRCAKALCLFAPKMLPKVKFLAWFTVNCSFSHNSDLAQTLTFKSCHSPASATVCHSHSTGGSHYCKWAVCCFLCCFFFFLWVFFCGLIATIKSLQNDNNLTVWDKIMGRITTLGWYWVHGKSF